MARTIPAIYTSSLLTPRNAMDTTSRKITDSRNQSVAGQRSHAHTLNSPTAMVLDGTHGVPGAETATDEREGSG
jgi:hypothetical protein